MIFMFKRKKRYLVLWATVLVSFFIASALLQHRFAPRHYGFLYLYFISCLWMAHPHINCEQFNFFKTKWLNTLGIAFISLVLISQVSASAVAVYYSWNYPFSNAVNVAKYIGENGLKERVVVGWRDDFMPSVIAYAGLKEIYYPQSGQFGTFVLFDENRIHPISMKEILSPVYKLGKKPEEFLFIICPELLGDENIEDWDKMDIFIDSCRYRFKILKTFYPAIALGESFTLLELQKQ